MLRNHRIFVLLIMAVSLPLAGEQSPDWYNEALRLYNEGKYENSLEKIRSVFDANSASYHLRILAAANHYRLGNTDSALAHLRYAEKADPSRYETYLLSAAVYRKTGKPVLAAGEIRKASSLNAPAEQIRTELARMYYESGQYAKARAETEALLALNAKNAEAMYIEALIFARQGRWESAEFRFRQILHTGGLPLDYQADFYNNLGYSLEQLSLAAAKSGRTAESEAYRKEAVTFYEKSLKIAPGHAAAKENLKRINASAG